MDWLSYLIEPFTYPFMIQALLSASITGIICALFSCFLVLKGWSLIGDALSHAIFPGVIIAFATGIPIMIGAFLSGLLCTLTSAYIKMHCRVKEDTVLGIVFSGMFALGLVIFPHVATDQHLSHLLFGNILGVTRYELVQVAIIAAVVFTILLMRKKDFVLYCFDPIQASVIGLSPKKLHYYLLSLLTLTIIASLQATGVIMVTAMLIAPGITGFVLTKKFNGMLIIALSVSVLSCLTGTLLSFYINGATGPMIVVVQAVLFILAQVKVWLTRRSLTT